MSDTATKGRPRRRTWQSPAGGGYTAVTSDTTDTSADRRITERRTPPREPAGVAFRPTRNTHSDA